jgi:hypothetical protein
MLNELLARNVARSSCLSRHRKRVGCACHARGYRRQIDEGRLRLEEAKKRRDRRNAVPIMLSFDLVGADAVHYKTLQSQFERFGWENAGGSCYRYPRLNEPQYPEDWLNCVIPALMFFRTYICGRDFGLGKYSLDTQTSTGAHEQHPSSGSTIKLSETANQHLPEARLRKWLDEVTKPNSRGRL